MIITCPHCEKKFEVDSKLPLSEDSALVIDKSSFLMQKSEDNSNLSRACLSTTIGNSLGFSNYVCISL